MNLWKEAVLGWPPSSAFYVTIERMERREYIIAEHPHNKMRLEDFLLGHFRTLSKMYLRDLVKTGQCEVNGRWENRGHKLKTNDFIEISVDHSRGTAMRPEYIPLDILFEDEELIVVNKPAEMLMHPSHRENVGTLLNALVFHLNRSEPPALAGGSDAELITTVTPPANAGGSNIAPVIRPGLPHRLDKQTSGLVVVAQTAMAHRVISSHFLKQRVEKLYLALVDGVVEPDAGEIKAPIGRFADLKFYGVKDDGKPALTRFKVRERYVDSTLLELEPVTGRTNQLRVHCESIGHPISGDIQRGGREHSRLCLHAYRLAFPHPVTRQRMRFESPIKF